MAARLMALGMLLLLALGEAAKAQGAPPVLSTAADPPQGSVAEPAQMSGMPLQVGDLPPGVVVVRVIRGNFATNVAGQRVTLREPLSTRAYEAVTDNQGRAQFDGFEVGTTVQAQATLDNEVLSSQMFALPAQGGVRVVLVAGIGAGVSIGADPPGTSRAQAAGRTWDLRLLFSVAFGLTGIVLGTLWTRKGRRRREIRTSRTPLRPRSPGESQERRRSDAFEDLVELEKAFRRGVIGEVDYAARREAVVSEIMAFDARSTSRDSG